MCIICLKPEGVEMPTDKEIKHMFEKNPHGAGFALQGDIYGDGRFLVEYHKGFMNVDDLIEALGPKEKLKNLTVAIHCRIKTSGETDKYTTHPFPISSVYGDLRKTDGKGPVLFHNGVFPGLGGLTDPKASDTQDFVVAVASRYLKNAKMPGKAAQAIVGKVIESCRVLIMYPKKDFPLLRWGTWYEHKGCYYSNTGYLDETSYQYSSRYPYKPASTVSEYRVKYDEWGCNVADYAWPSEEDDWIRFDDKRWENLKAAIREETHRAGETVVTFAATGVKEWILDEDNKQIYTSDRREDVKLREEEDEEFAMENDVSMMYHEEGYMWFADDYVLEDWLDRCKQIGDYEYRFKGEIWYIDTINCEAYTDKGIKKYFAPGQQGHVRRKLKEYGYCSEHDRDAYIEQKLDSKYAYPTDDDYELDSLENLTLGRN